MAGTTKPKLSLEDTLAAVLAHPVRVRCFVAFNERTTSAAQLVRAWGLSGEKHWRVGHHVRVLAKLGIIEEVWNRRVRGSVERFYRATARPIVFSEEFAKLSYDERDRFTRYILQLIVTDATLAVDQEVFDARTDRTIIRLPMIVDEQGFRDMGAEEKDTYERRLEIATKSAGRNAERRRRGDDLVEINIRSVTMFHEAASGGGALADPPPEVAQIDALGVVFAGHASAPLANVNLEVTLAEVLKHPVRVRCFVVLNERIASATQMMRAWGLPDVGRISPHIKVLMNLGLVEEVWNRPVRGSVERFYRATSRPILYSEDLDKMTYEERDNFTRYILQLIVTDAALAVEERIFDRRTDRGLIRMPMNVDEEGFDEMVTEEKASYKRRLEIGKESESRIEARRRRGEVPEEIDIRSVTMLHIAASGGGALADPPREIAELDAFDDIEPKQS